MQLSNKQKALVAENHNLIYGYAHKYNINVEEYYDVLAIGLCMAALSYNSNKGAFSTHAYMMMRKQMYYQISYEHCKKRDINKLDKMSDAEEICSYKPIAKTVQLEDEVIGNIEANAIMKYLKENLTDFRYKVITLLIKGYKQRDICRELDAKRQRVSLAVRTARELINEYYEYNRYKGEENVY